jgi:L-lactate utilization protein LutC
VDRVVVVATSRAAYERLKSSLPTDPRVRVLAASDVVESMSAMDC